MKETKKLELARGHLIEASKLLSDLIEGAPENNSGDIHQLEDWMEDRVELWCRIYNLGGIVTDKQLRELWEGKMKKNMKGIGGFFVGRGASLSYTTDERVVLTSKASDSILAWTGKEIKEYAKKYLK